jgi:hypothetical protein
VEDEVETNDWLIRGGMGLPDALLKSAEDALEEDGIIAISLWGLPGDTIEDASRRLPAPYGKIRPVRRSTLLEAGYSLVDRPDGHTDVILPTLTLEACSDVAALLEPTRPNPSLR